MVIGVELVKILVKLRDSLKEAFTRHKEFYSFAVASRIARLVVSFGDFRGRKWARDLGFVWYLTVLDFNRLPEWGV